MRLYCVVCMTITLFILSSCSNDTEGLNQEITNLRVELSQLDDQIKGAKKSDGWKGFVRDNEEVKALKERRDRLKYILDRKEKDRRELENRSYFWPIVKFLLKILAAPFLVFVFRRDAFKGRDRQNLMIDIGLLVALLIVIFVIF